LLQLRNIQKSFNSNSINELHLFQDFNLEIAEGEFVVILGSNGSGKSTLLNLIDGQISADKGKIQFLNQDITSFPSFKRCQMMSRVFQDPSLGTSPSLSIVQNMSLALNKGKPFNLSQGVNLSIKNKIVHLVSMLQLGLEDKLDMKVSNLSGGQRQALSLLMAVCCEPRLLLLDEHTAALDPKTSQHMMKLTQKLINEFRMTTIMITHQIKDALDYGNRCIMLHGGNIVFDVKCDEKKNLQPQDLLTRFHSLSLE
jgi:putative tryptophan/tyrosine transport system ATP-binding protein